MTIWPPVLLALVLLAVIEPLTLMAPPSASKVTPPAWGPETSIEPALLTLITDLVVAVLAVFAVLAAASFKAAACI